MFRRAKSAQWDVKRRPKPVAVEEHTHPEDALCAGCGNELRVYEGSLVCAGCGAMQAMVDGQPLPRPGLPAEVAEAYMYFMRGAYTTGQVAIVDGGRLFM
jgi:NAD(P)-dependent dehydrogenase (short-subunit alcohol dehydrogenase family)